jgi:hypothetical protein
VLSETVRIKLSLFNFSGAVTTVGVKQESNLCWREEMKYREQALAESRQHGVFFKSR